jgi:outer membrane receptor protein involved in Fe transport
MKAFVVLMALVLIAPAAVYAQGTTGTVRGKVTDQSTGESLAAVNVVLFEIGGDPTSMGNFTNAEGEYVIVNVPPGRYNLRATMMGYKTTEVEALLVTVGVSTNQNFALETTVLDVGEVVTVTAERDIIQRDVTATQQSYTIEEMERMAVSTTTDIIALQTNTFTLDSFQDDIPGYYDRGLEQVHMRGGRNAEVAFMIDGMQVTNLVFGGQAATVSPFSLSEMVVMAGGMSAEFGNAMSGVINMVTREGGQNYNANFEYSTSELGSAVDTAEDLNRIQAYVGGPVPVAPRLTFFLSGSGTNSRDYVVGKDDITYDYKADPLDPNWQPNPNIDYWQIPTNPDGSYDWASFDPVNDYLLIYEQRDTTPSNRRIHGTDLLSGFLGYGYDNRWDTMLNLTNKFTANMKLTLGGMLNGRWSVPYTNVWRHAALWGLPSWYQNYLVLGYPHYASGITDPDAYVNDPYYINDPLINPDNNQDWKVGGSGNTDFENEKNRVFNNNYRLSGVFTHQLNQSTFYTIRTAYYDYNRTMRVDRFVNDAGWIRRMEHLYNGLDQDSLSPTFGQPLPPDWQPGDDMRQVTLIWYQGETGYDETDDIKRVYGYRGWSSSGAGISYEGSDRYFTDQHDRTRSFKGDVTSQMTTHHQVKAGVQYNDLTLDMLDVQFPWNLVPSQTRYIKRPWEFGAYLQDKIEYDFMIVNVGLRYESANSGKNPYWIDPRNPINPDTTLTDEERLIISPRDYENDTGFATPRQFGSTFSQLSPRIGISHPVTDQAVIYFNYGHFYQKPIYRNVYRVNRIDRGNPITGNPNLEQEKTISYEFGYKHQFTDIYAMELTLWAKDQSNLVGTERVPAWFRGAPNPYDYAVAVNYDYAASRGFDLALRKRYSSYWSARASYSYMKTESNRDDPWAGYRAGDNGSLLRQPKRPRVVGWDQPHAFTSSLSLQLPEGVGPEIGGVRPFHKISVSLIFRAAAGRPYTPQNDEGIALEPNSGRRPWTMQWDFRVYRDFESFGLRYSIFADVRNLFDRTNIVSVFSRTGQPDDPGPEATGYSDQYDNYHYYGSPRRINMGLRIYF